MRYYIGKFLKVQYSSIVLTALVQMQSWEAEFEHILNNDSFRNLKTNNVTLNLILRTHLQTNMFM